MGSLQIDVLNCLTDPILVIDAEYKVVFANQAMAVLCGIETERIIGSKCHELSHHSPHPCTELELDGRPCNHAHVFGSGTALRQQHRHLLPDGRVMLFDMTSSPVRDGEGRITHLVQVLRDITKQEELRVIAAEKHFELENIFSIFPLSIAAIDTDLRVLWINDATEELTGLQSHEVQGKFCYDLWGQHAADRQKKGLQRICDSCEAQLAMRNGKAHFHERKVGDRIFSIITLPLTTSNKTIIGAMEFGFDITERRKTEEELKNSERRLRILFENSPTPLYVADFSGIKRRFDTLRQNGVTDLAAYLVGHQDEVNKCLEYITILEINQAVLALAGLPSKEEFFANIKSLLKKIPLHENPEGLLAIARGEKSASQELTIFSASDEKLYTILHWTVEPGYEQNYARVLFTIVDITDRKKAESAILTNAERMRLLHEIDQAMLEAASTEEIGRVTLSLLQDHVHCASGCVILFDYKEQRSSLLACSREAASGFCSDSELALRCSEYLECLRSGQTFLLPDIAAEKKRCPIGEMLFAEDFRFFLSVPLLTKDGLIGALNLLDFAPRTLRPEQITFVGQVAPILAVAIQNASLLSSLSLQKEELQALTRRLAEAEEAERRRLAAELHDEVGQNLSALAINLDIFKKQAPRQQATGQKRLDDSITLIDQLTGQIRSVMADLRPPVMDDYGLLASIHWFANRFTARTGILVDVRGEEADPRLSAGKEIALFRVVQEALNNAAKHAMATSVAISLQPADSTIRLDIRDNGRGFVPKDSGKPAAMQHQWGLLFMRERIEAFNGHFSLHSAPGIGTCITVEVPL